MKSLDGWSVEEAEVTALGTLRHDREWALADLAGNFLNAKRDPRLHQIRATYSESLSEITLALPTRPPTTFSMQDTPALERWFTEFFEKEVRWIQDTDHGFPDDLEANGPTVISEASLRVVGEWFGLDLEESRRRFRTNLELTDAPAFWEDRCYGAAGEAVEVQIGKLRLLGSNPCQRCAVPSPV